MSEVARAARLGCITAIIGGAAYVAGHAIMGLLMVNVVGAVLHPVIRLIAL
jgi:hypothetical protein